MERITKLFCGFSNTSKKEPHFVHSFTQPSDLSFEPSLRPISEQHLETPLEFCISDDPNCRMLRVMKNNNAFTITAARFSPNGITHNVVINFNKGGTKMNLNIDGEQILNIDSKTQSNGNFKFVIDGMFVEFLWAIKKKPMRFLFHTRVAISGGSSSSNYGGKSNNSGGGHDTDSSDDDDVGKSTWSDKQWKKYEEGYTLEIFGF